MAEQVQLSARARKVLMFVIAYKMQMGGDSPSFRRIMRGCGLRSTSLVGLYLRELESAGLVAPVAAEGDWRDGIRVLGAEWRLRGEQARGEQARGRVGAGNGAG